MRRPLAAALLGALALCACTRLQDVAPGTVVTCADASECPSGQVCTRGRCLAPSAIDTTPPDYVGTVAVAPGRVRAGEAFTVTVEVTEPLEGPPALSMALVPPVPVPCAATVASRYACSYTPTGAENDGRGGVIALDLRLRDLAGNDTARSGVAAVTLDFAPPAPKVAVVAYAPAPSNPLPAVRRAAGGTGVRVVVSADEALSAAAPPALTARLGAAALTFTPSAEPGLGVNDAAFVTTLAGVEPDGVYTLAVTWADDLGNRGTALVPATVEVKTSAPTLLVNQDALVFVRSPWGSAAPEDLGGYTIPAGPYFAVEPTDPLSAATVLPAGALLLDAGAVPAAVLVRSSPAPTALAVGTLRPDAGGRLPRQPLYSPDLAGVWLVGVDDAGNLSAPVRLRASEWIVTPAAPAFGASPHALLATGYVRPTREQPEGDASVDRAAVAGADGAAATVRARGVWSEATWNGTAPSPRVYHAVAYDSARGRVVLFGGWSGSLFLGDTWEWDGRSWTRVATTGPSPRNYHSMAYDAARGRVVLFGGTANSTALGDTWEWDGATWRQVASAGPGPRSASAMMVYDAVRGQVVLFGGYGGNGTGKLADTWAWDGKAWTRVATSGPPARAEGALAFDEGRGRVVLFGGIDPGLWSLQDTWEWDGSLWTTTAASAPPARYGHALAYDASRGRTVLFGGAGGQTDTWEWNGTAWAQLPATGPRGGPRMVYDAARRRLVLHGGYYWAALGDTYVLTGTTWTRVAAGGPPARSEHAMASDTGRGRVVLAGGRDTNYMSFGDTWEWNGTVWAQAAGATSPARYRHTMAYDSARGRTVLLGGQSATSIWLGDGAEWDGASWTTITAATPTARRWAAMAYDAGANKRLVLFGGENGALQDTWTWTGAGAWTPLTTVAPGPRQGHAMAYDALRDRTVLFGGTNTSTGADSGDTWTLSGSTWTVSSTTGPSARSGSAIAYDGARHRVVLFGGVTSAGRRFGDTWEWDGSSWTTVATAGPTPRFQHAMAYDAARAQVVLHGGNDAQGTAGDTWLWSAPRDHQPAVQLDVALSPFGVDPALITRVGVRAFAGGTSGDGSGPGATLWGWAHRGAANEPGAWIPLDANASGLPAAGAAALLTWQSSSAAEGRRLLLANDGFAFQVRPAGGAGDAPDGAAVALDHLEVRVRYAVPP